MSDEEQQIVQARFGQRLRAVRESKKISQEDLASDSGVGRSYLSGVERGKRNIALVNICRLAKALDVHPSQLLQFDIQSGGSENSVAP
ncbi:hypothetical protein CDL60_26220 [Roseateles noduli]|nr:hypothetical protein CDL60_26220 [Roseateles noduli]